MNLRRVFADICKGYSVTEWRGKPAYIKHLTHFDQVDIDEVHDAALEAAVTRGIPKEETKLAWLKEKGLWTVKDQIELNMQRDYVKTLAITKTKLIFKAQIELHVKTMVEEQIKLHQMTARRDDLIDLTAEQVADRKVQFTYLSQAFRRDETLKERMLDDKAVRKMDDETTSELLDLYVSVLNHLSGDNIRHIAVADYFTNSFYLCGEHIVDFFGKPVCDLTMHQGNLLSWGLYFKNILTNNNVPDDVRHDPDRLEEYVNKSAALKKVLGNAQGDRVGLVGTAEDFKALGLTDGSAEMQGIIAKQYRTGMDAASDLGFTVK